LTGPDLVVGLACQKTVVTTTILVAATPSSIFLVTALPPP
jgi:hypothetical protein